MTWLSRVNPTPSFPAHTGPYKVGSIDVEIPTSQLQCPSTAASSSSDLSTVAFRVFYPAKNESDESGARWIPSPQREYISAYARFLGANSAFAAVFSLIPQLLYYISMPVHQNAALLEPTTTSKRWPVMIFSHGLGGSRNAYSHICGSLASHGVVVVAPDHRDGSSPLAIYNSPNSKEKRKRVDYEKIDHKPSTEVYEARDRQLRVRLSELGLIHDALLKMDEGRKLENTALEQLKKSERNLIGMFSNALNVHEPGAISFAGHSFGACTMIQFVKSVYYRQEEPIPGYKPLYKPTENSSIVRQITPANPIILLDLWTLPIQSPNTTWLRSQPMPSYDTSAGGKNILAILSEGFFNWKSNYNEVKRVLARPTGAKSKSPPGPYIFYPVSSAHLSQSDFGVLFPWVTTKIFGTKEPERVLRLNTRAILQVMRESGIRVANTSPQDLEMTEVHAKNNSTSQDTMILSRASNSVRDWINLSADSDLYEADRVDGQSLVEPPIERIGGDKVGSGPGNAMLEGEALGQMVQDKSQ
ncbi:hypothetical protein ACEQ8H_001746 [Pleosporales sp. CAS-2024a]